MKQLLFDFFWWITYKKVRTKDCDCKGCIFENGDFCDKYWTKCEPEGKHYIYVERFNKN